MKNQQLQQELERIGGYNEKKLKVSTDTYELDTYHLDINDNGFMYYSLSDLVYDCIELSKLFEVEFE